MTLQEKVDDPVEIGLTICLFHISRQCLLGHRAHRHMYHHPHNTIQLLPGSYLLLMRFRVELLGYARVHDLAVVLFPVHLPLFPSARFLVVGFQDPLHWA